MMKVRIGLVAALLGVVTLTGSTQQQSLDWARRDGGVNVDGAEAIAVDAGGNSYVIGTYVVQATFGAGEGNATTLTNVGAIPSQDIFLAKYSSAGALVWAIGIDGLDPSSGGFSGQDFAGGVAVGPGGDVYITGTLFQFATETNIGGVLFEQAGGFVARLNSDGQAQWVTSLGADGGGWAVDVDTGGNAYVAGSAGGEPALWSVSGGGAVSWLEQGEGAQGPGLGVAVAAAGTVRVAGRFLGAATFGASQANETTLTTTNGTADGFVASYDANGTLLWARQTESTVGAWAEGIASDPDGNSYLTGAMHGDTTFGRDEPGETTLTAFQVGDAWVGKLDASGSLIWVRPINASGNAYGMAIAADETGRSYVTGFFGGAVTFGANEATETTFNGLGTSDVFLARYETNGGFEWVSRTGGPSLSVFGEFGHGVALDASSNVYLTGFFTDTTTVGESEPGSIDLTADGSTDVFVARYMNDVPPPGNLDLDIAQFRVTKRVSLAHADSVELRLAVRNNGTVEGSAMATVVGVQNGNVVYSETLTVSDEVGNGRTTFSFPAFTPVAAGDVTWTVTIADTDPDVDEVQAASRVVGDV